jgi:hypothetical protein
MAQTCSAENFLQRLSAAATPEERRKLQRYFKSGEGNYGDGDVFLGVRMGEVFALAKEFIAMEPAEIELLLESPLHEARAGAMSIMDKQGRAPRTSKSRRKELFELYLRRHDRINNWDLVDLGAPFVVGRYLADKGRGVLDTLALSGDLWERRTAIVATAYYIRQGEIDDTFRIAELLLGDREDLIHKAVGGWVRQAGTVDRDRLLRFLDERAATMPRTMLRYAIEHLEAEQRAHYLGLKHARRRWAANKFPSPATQESGEGSGMRANGQPMR